MLYHVNAKTGVAGECSATKNKCPFGTVDEHFTSAEAARSAFEASQKSFEKSESKDLSQTLPQWHDVLPRVVELKIAKELNDSILFLQAVDSGAIEIKYADPEQFLTPPVYAIRGRSTYFTDNNGFSAMPPGEFLVAIHSRQGDGNRECFCDDLDALEDEHDDGCLAQNNSILENHPQYFSDEDENDPTYSTHYFHPGTTQADVDKHMEQFATARKASMTRETLRSIEANEAPPWSVLTTDKTAMTQYTRHKLNARYKETSDREALARRDVTAKVLQKIAKDETLLDTDLTEVMQAAALSDWEKRNLDETYRGYLAAKKENISTAKRVAQAEALPDNELKKYLLGDRGTGSYNVEEKVGRRKVKVLKTYERGTLLGKELESSISSVKSSKSSLASRMDKIVKANESASTAIKENEKFFKEMGQLRAKAWAAGWPGLMRDVPAIPEAF